MKAIQKYCVQGHSNPGHGGQAVKKEANCWMGMKGKHYYMICIRAEEGGMHQILWQEK